MGISCCVGVYMNVVRKVCSINTQARCKRAVEYGESANRSSARFD